MLPTLFIFGLITGSLISAITWRLPRGLNYVNDRSKCDKCNTKISWYDNIPLFSYLVLAGKCRSCGKKISARYPLIELSTGIIFVMTYLFSCVPNLGFNVSPVCYINDLKFLALPYLLFIAALMIAIFVTDFELQIIPDEFVLLGLMITFPFFPLFARKQMYEHYFAGFLAGGFLLLLHFLTKGRGMGLGDVKLALLVGMILGLKLAMMWLYLAFVIGAIVGIILIKLQKTQFGRHIAFGPFLVISFFVVLFWGESMAGALFPFLN